MRPDEFIAFLSELATHTNKAWFDAHRAEYDRLRDAFIELIQSVVDQLVSFDPAITGVDAAKSLYRINRDIRFSKDKRPYKTTFGAVIQPGGKKSAVPGYYLHVNESSTLLIAAGVHEPTPEQLLTIRRAIAAPHSELAAAMHDGLNHGFTAMEDDALKKVPSGWPADHPQAELLKLKHAVLYREAQLSNESDLAQLIAGDCRGLWPLARALRTVLA